MSNEGEFKASETKAMAVGGGTDVLDGEVEEVKLDATILKNAHVDVKQAYRDKALDLLTHHQTSNIDLNSPEAKRVLRKIDMWMMPMMIGVYWLQLMDKNSLSFAALMGIKEDAHLTGDQYSWLGSLVYFGYLFGELPAAFLMQRVHLTKYLGTMCMLWGILVALHAVCRDFASLATVRFLLGAIEVCTAPTIIYITGAFYTQSEQVSRTALWYITSGWATVFGGFFAWCIWQSPVASFRWQALFIFYGVLTFVVGVLVFFFSSASPAQASWLSEEEKVIALARVRNNRTGSEMWRFNTSQLRECFVDPRFYLIFFLLVSTGLPNGGVTAFGPTIIAGFGFTTEESTLLSMVPGAGMVVGSGIAVLIARYTNRTIAGIWTLTLACVGVVMMLAIPSENYAARYGGYVLMYQFPVCVLFIIAYMTGGVAGSTKKVGFSAVYQIGYAVGNIIGPQTYVSADAPNYYPAKFTMLAFLLFTAFLIAATGLLHRFWNQQRDKQLVLDNANGIVHEHVENEEFMDKTDFQLRSFRYPL